MSARGGAAEHLGEVRLPPRARCPPRSQRLTSRWRLQPAVRSRLLCFTLPRAWLRRHSQGATGTPAPQPTTIVLPTRTRTWPPVRCSAAAGCCGRSEWGRATVAADARGRAVAIEVAVARTDLPAAAGVSLPTGLASPTPAASGSRTLQVSVEDTPTRPHEVHHFAEEHHATRMGACLSSPDDAQDVAVGQRLQRLQVDQEQIVVVLLLGRRHNTRQRERTRKRARSHTCAWCMSVSVGTGECGKCQYQRTDSVPSECLKLGV